MLVVTGQGGRQRAQLRALRLGGRIDFRTGRPGKRSWQSPSSAAPPIKPLRIPRSLACAAARAQIAASAGKGVVTPAADVLPRPVVRIGRHIAPFVTSISYADWEARTREPFLMREGPGVGNGSAHGICIHHQVLAATRQWLKPVIYILIRCGVTWRDFSELAKTTFVEVATRQFGKRGRPTNVSRTAVLTGLARRDVREAAREGSKRRPSR